MLAKVLEKMSVVSWSKGPTEPESLRPAENATCWLTSGTTSREGAESFVATLLYQSQYCYHY